LASITLAGGNIMAKSDYDQPYEPNRNTQSDMRVGLAADHAAHHLGRISKALERIADALEKKVDGGTF
jgi:hypothetical protein